MYQKCTSFKGNLCVWNLEIEKKKKPTNHRKNLEYTQLCSECKFLCRKTKIQMKCNRGTGENTKPYTKINGKYKEKNPPWV